MNLAYYIRKCIFDAVNVTSNLKLVIKFYDYVHPVFYFYNNIFMIIIIVLQNCSEVSINVLSARNIWQWTSIMHL